MKTVLMIATIPGAAVSAFSMIPAAEPLSSCSFQQVADLRFSRRRSRLMLWRRNSSIPSSSQALPNKYKLQAYTVFSEDNHNKNPWFNFLNFRESVVDYADSLFSLEGGEATSSTASNTRPFMTNEEVEQQLTTAAVTTPTTVMASSKVSVSEKGEFLMELNSLSETFDDLQSRYEATIDSLKDENSFLEEGIKMLTATIEGQAEQIEQLQKQNLVEKEEAEGDFDGIGAIFENKALADELNQVQSKVETLERDNEMLRQRIRALEMDLSDVAFESRKIVSSSAAKTEAPAAAVELEVVQTTAEVNAAVALEDIAAAPSDEGTDDVIVDHTKAIEALSPHAPTAPVPKHLLQQKEIEALRSQVRKYETERKSVRKLFGRGIRRGAEKVGKVLDLWRPIYLILFGVVRGDGKMAL